MTSQNRQPEAAKNNRVSDIRTGRRSLVSSRAWMETASPMSKAVRMKA